MIDVLLIVGHQPWRPGAANMGGPGPADDVYEFEFNLPLVKSLTAILSMADVDADMDIYARGGGNVTRWSGASRLLVEFHCNAFNEQATGTETLYAIGSDRGEAAAREIQKALVEELKLPDRGIKPKTRSDRGGYLLHGVSQPAIIPEPFFIDKDSDLARAREANLYSAYAAGIINALEAIKETEQ